MVFAQQARSKLREHVGNMQRFQERRTAKLRQSVHHGDMVGQGPLVRRNGPEERRIAFLFHHIEKAEVRTALIIRRRGMDKFKFLRAPTVVHTCRSYANCRISLDVAKFKLVTENSRLMPCLPS